MRPWDLAAIGITLATSLLIVQATWNPPEISPADAGGHVGERVRMQGMAIDVRQYDDVARFVLVADGAAVHARAEGIVVQTDTWVTVTATIDREGGRPLLRVETLQAQAANPADFVDLVTLAREPAQHADRLIQVQGYLERGILHDKGVSLTTTAHGAGSVTLSGVLRYEACCLCHTFHADAWTP